MEYSGLPTVTRMAKPELRGQSYCSIVADLMKRKVAVLKTQY